MVLKKAVTSNTFINCQLGENDVWAISEEERKRDVTKIASFSFFWFGRVAKGKHHHLLTAPLNSILSNF